MWRWTTIRQRSIASRQLQGAINKAQGNLFEQLISASCEHYKEKGIAHIDKTPEPMKVIKNMGEGKFLACFVKAAQPDYKGTLRTGKAVVFEAKLSTSDRIEQSVVTEHQADALEAHSRMGALAFVLVSLDFQSFYRVPWGAWRNMKQIYGRKHMKAAELEQYRVRFTGNRVEFLEV